MNVACVVELISLICLITDSLIFYVRAISLLHSTQIACAELGLLRTSDMQEGPKTSHICLGLISALGLRFFHLRLMNENEPV